MTAPVSTVPVSAAPSPTPFSALTGTGTTKVWLACGVTDMRKGFDGLAVLVQQVLEHSPHSGALFAFRGKRGHLIKLLWYDGQGLCLFSRALSAPLRYGLSVSDSLHLASDKDARIASLEALLAERDVALAEAKAELLHRDLLIETQESYWAGAAGTTAPDAVRGVVREAVWRDRPT